MGWLANTDHQCKFYSGGGGQGVPEKLFIAPISSSVVLKESGSAVHEAYLASRGVSVVLWPEAQI